jgi:class 3 adenylate cyclase
MEPEVRYCTTSDGVRIAYTVMGSGPPILGMVDPLSSHVQLEWSHPTAGAIQREYIKRNTLVRFDPRGSGLSDRVLVKSVADVVLDIEAVVERVGLEHFAVQSVLSSTLPMIVYASRHPERVSRFLIFDGFLRMRELVDTPEAQALIAAARANWHVATEAIGYVAFGAGSDVNARHGEFIRACVGPENLMGLEDSIGFDVTEAARGVQAPTLVMKHKGVPIITMEVTKELAATIPNAQLLVVEGTFVDDIASGTTERALAFINDEAPRETTPAQQAPGIPSGTAIILFADIVDSTALTERLGDAAFRERARQLDDAMRTAIKQSNGTAIEGKLLGDGVLAVFTAARDAIIAALACRDASANVGLQLHLGLHAGDVIREKDNVYGGAVNIAARISALSAPGEVLVSDTIRSLARTSAGVSFQDRGEHALKGIDDPVRIYAITPA